MTDNKDKRPAFDVLMGILAMNYWLGRTPAGDPVVVSHRRPCVMIPLTGRGGLRSVLAAEFYGRTGKGAPNEALAQVISAVDGGASRQARVATPWLRLASQGGDQFLDLGDASGAAVVISPASTTGWEISTRVPVLFRRSALTHPLPVPVPGGSLDSTRHLLNIAAGGEWTAYTAARITSLLFPRATHPAEIFTSDTSGSLKTATVKNTKSWIDPGPLLSMPADARSWAATASNVYVAAVDNVSWISDWWSDLLCKGSSGDSFTSRTLYTDNDATAAEFSVVPLLDGIGMVSMRADLADRAIRYRLRRPASYLGDDEVAGAWERGHADALGWLLDQAVAVARLMPYTPRPRTGRLSNYEWVLVTLDRLWWTGGTGHRWWTGSQLGVAEDAVAGDMLASAIAARFASPAEIPAGQLLSALAGGLQDEGREPWTPQKIGKRMPRAADALTKTGWHLERKKAEGHDKARSWMILPPGTWTRRPDGSIGPRLALPAGPVPVPPRAEN